MPNASAWIICEMTGRWTVALRVALARRGSPFGSSRIQEARSLAELAVAAAATPSGLVLIEVRPENLAASLNWFFQGWQRGARAVALLDAELAADQATDALLEAGALAVIDSPRRIAAVLGISGRLVSQRSLAKQDRSAKSIAERAWAALPWQDA
jgi:hypothetical protein